MLYNGVGDLLFEFRVRRAFEFLLGGLYRLTRYYRVYPEQIGYARFIRARAYLVTRIGDGARELAEIPIGAELVLLDRVGGFALVRCGESYGYLPAGCISEG